MARQDRRFNGIDVIRIFEENLSINDKRLVIAWFFSQIPVKEPKVDVLQLILDLVGLIPVAGSAAALFQISIATAQAVKDIAEIFGFSFEEEEVELARLKFELKSAEDAFKKAREEVVALQLSLDASREQTAALRGTIELLEDELRMIETGTALSPAQTTNLMTKLERIRFSAENIDRLTGPNQGEGYDWVKVDNSVIVIRQVLADILEIINNG